MINKHKSNKIKENSNTVRHLNNGTDHRHSKSCCDQSSPARRTMSPRWEGFVRVINESVVYTAMLWWDNSDHFTQLIDNRPTCVTHVPWCMPGWITGGFLWNRWRGKVSRNSQRMHNPQFYVSDKRYKSSNKHRNLWVGQCGSENEHELCC